MTFAIADAGLHLVDPSLDLSAYPLDPAEVMLFLTGMLGFAPEGGVFTECLTGRIYPVAQEGAYADAAAAYAATSGRRDDAPLFASLKGRLTPRPTADTPDGMALVIESFSRFDQDQQSCPAPFSSDQ